MLSSHLQLRCVAAANRIQGNTTAGRFPVKTRKYSKKTNKTQIDIYNKNAKQTETLTMVWWCLDLK